MKKVSETDEMLPEYNFKGGIRGKYSKRYAEETNIVLIDQDVHEFFPDQKSVNEALRTLAAIIKKSEKSRSSVKKF